jgi:hypothetical protein
MLPVSEQLVAQAGPRGMTRWRRTRASCLALCAALACASPFPEPREPDAVRARQRFAQVTLAELQTGREVFLNRCPSCHTLPSLSRYTPEQWPGVVQRMSEPAKLSAEQERQLTAYVVTMAETSPRK